MHRAVFLVAGLAGLACLAACAPTHDVLSPSIPSSPCDVAARERARVSGLLAEGRLDRTVRVIERADRLCPSSAAESRRALTSTLAELRSESPLSVTEGRALYAQARAAAESGRRADAQRLFDRARAQLERAVGAPTTVEASSELARGAREAAWSEDGRHLALAAGSSISLRDATSGFREAMRLEQQSDVGAVSMSPDGRFLAASAAQHDVALWDLTTGRELARLAQTAGASEVRFSPDGERLGVLFATVELRDATTHRKLAELPPYRASVRVFAFSPDGATIAAGLTDGSIHLADARSGADLRTLSGHTELVSTLTFSSDGRMLVSGSFDGTVRAWDVASGHERRRFGGSTGTIVRLDLAPDDKTLAVMTEEELPDHRDVHHPIRIWDLATGKLVREIPNRETGPHTSLAFSPDGERLALAYHHVHVWDVATGDETVTLGLGPSRVASVAASSGGVLASAMADGTVRLWSTQPGAPERGALRTLHGHTQRVFGVAFLPGSDTLASVSGDDNLRLWDVRTGSPRRVVQAHTGGFRSLAASRDGAKLATGSHDGTVRMWDVATGAEAATMRGHAQSVSSVAFCGDAVIASSSYDETARLWDVTTGKERQRIEPSRGPVACRVDGGRLATVDDAGVELWSVATNLEAGRVPAPPEVRALVFSDRGSALVTASHEGVVQRRDLGSGTTKELIGRARGPQALAVFASGVAGDGVVAAEDDGSIHLWSADGRPMVRLRAVAGHDAGVAISTAPGTLQAELLGEDVEAAAGELLCRIGPLSFPFDLCRERAEVHGLLARALAPDAARRALRGGMPEDEP